MEHRQNDKEASAMGVHEKNIVYVVGAGLSAGLGFPTIMNLLPAMWKRIENAGLAADLAKIIRFHHPYFNPTLTNTFPNIEELLSEMQANEQLFRSSSPVTGTFTPDDLMKHRQSLLLELAGWFHMLKKDALRRRPRWLRVLASKMKEENAQVISFNWDLVLDELLFGKNLNAACYGFDGAKQRVRLLKPHGSLNWYGKDPGSHIMPEKRFKLGGAASEEVFAFRPYRAPNSTRRSYMPLIVPPVFAKQFRGTVFERLWREVVSVISVASEVRFLGYSLAPADFHARFILRCGFHNQEEGLITKNKKRTPPTGRARVVIIDPCADGKAPQRIEEAVGWKCEWYKQTVEEWIGSHPKRVRI